MIYLKTMSSETSERRLQALLGHLRPAADSPAGVNVSGGASYRYTLDSSVLTPEQRAAYEENGFVVVRRLVGEDKLKVFRDRFREICSGTVQVKEGMARIAYTPLSSHFPLFLLPLPLFLFIMN